VKKENIKQAASKTRIWLITPKIKPFQFLIAICAIMLFVFMETDLFEEWSDMGKVSTYVLLIVLSVFSGISLIDLKEIGAKFKAIIEDKKLGAWAKVRAFMNLGVEILSRAGEAWDLVYEEQFEEQKKEDEEPIDSVEQ
jgi:hypothetical protein